MTEYDIKCCCGLEGYQPWNELLWRLEEKSKFIKMKIERQVKIEEYEEKRIMWVKACKNNNQNVEEETKEKE